MGNGAAMSDFKSPSPKPNLFEVARGLDNLGHTATALELLRAVGVKEIPAAAAEKTRYTREKLRSAYIHVKVEADVEKQKSVLADFRNSLSTRGFGWLPPMDKDHLIEVVLPGPTLVCAYRVPLDKFQSSRLPKLIAGSKILGAYTRKPRADAQHHKNKE
jgi:hypothetical protein